MGDSEVTSNHTVLRILVSTLALGFQRYPFFTGGNIRPQSCYAPHTAVTSAGEERASGDFYGLQRGCRRKQLEKESGLGELKAAGCGQWTLQRNAQGS